MNGYYVFYHIDFYLMNAMDEGITIENHKTVQPFFHNHV